VTRPLSFFRLLWSLVVVFGLVSAASAQGSADDDAALDLAEPDFSVVNLPTTLRLPVGKGDFHLTHRFAGNLRQGDFGDQLGDLFGLDRGATIGLEFRYGVARHLEAIVHRSSFEKTIQLSAKYDAIHQADAMPVSISGLVSVEGPDNFKERRAPALGAVVSREVGDRLAVYASPVWVHNSAAAIGEKRDTFYVGLAGRARIASTVYVVAEASPRVAGYVSGQVEYGFGIEKRAGAHVFQLTFANTFCTTLGGIVRGGSPETLYLGFNLTRKFF
jgi:Membrane bound beta barrel domain (DUF5777)